MYVLISSVHKNTQVRENQLGQDNGNGYTFIHSSNPVKLF